MADKLRWRWPVFLRLISFLVCLQEQGSLHYKPGNFLRSLSLPCGAEHWLKIFREWLLQQFAEGLRQLCFRTCCLAGTSSHSAFPRKLRSRHGNPHVGVLQRTRSVGKKSPHCFVKEERKRLCSFPFASPKLTNKIKKKPNKKVMLWSWKAPLWAAVQPCRISFLLLEFSWSRGAAHSRCRWKALSQMLPLRLHATQGLKMFCLRCFYFSCVGFFRSLKGLDCLQELVS